jgi:hypothetical protein
MAHGGWRGLTAMVRPACAVTESFLRERLCPQCGAQPELIHSMLDPDREHGSRVPVQLRRADLVGKRLDRNFTPAISVGSGARLKELMMVRQPGTLARTRPSGTLYVGVSGDLKCMPHTTHKKETVRAGAR